MVWHDIWNSRTQLLLGLRGTVVLSVVSLVTATALGVAVGLLRSRRIRGLQLLLRIYLEIFRGSPLLVQLFFIYFGSAYLGLDGVTTFVAAVAGLTLYEGAYISEIVRAGLESIPPGQDEAARSLGLRTPQRLWWVILPQAVRVVLPALIGQWIALIKDSALASAIGYSDLLQQGEAIYTRNAHPFQVLTVVAAIYFVVCSPLTLIERRQDRRRSRA